MNTADFKQYADLLERARSGDDEAFREIYRRTKGAQIYHLQGILGPGEDIQDALQEVYSLLYQNQDKINPPTVFVAYLNRLTYYVARNMERKEARRKQTFVSLDWLENMEGEKQTDALGNIERQERIQIVRDSINNLPAQERSVVFMRYYQKLSHKDVAMSLGVTVARSKRLLQLAHKHLKADLEEKGIRSWGVLLGPAFGLSISESGQPAGAEEGASSASAECAAGNAGEAGLGLISGGVSARAAGAAGGIAAAVGIAATLIFGGLFDTPEVRSVQVSESSPAATAQVDVTVDSRLPVSRLVLTGDNGREYYGVRLSGNTYRAIVADNGTYTVTAKTNSGKSAVASAQVDCIDRKNPTVREALYEDGATKIYFAADESGIAYDNIYCTDASGAVTKPSYTDPSKDLAVFYLPEEDLTLHFEDKAGNTSELPLYFN